MFRFLLVALAMLMLMGAGNTQAQSYPDRVIKVICAFAPGSGADILVRYYAHKLGEISKASVIVENRTGAQGNIGTEFVARAKPDGYTILITANTALTGAPHFFKNLSFDPLKDLEPVGSLARLGFVLSVNAEKPYKNVAELTAALKAKEKHGFYGTTVNTGIAAGEIYKVTAGLQTERIPYKNVTDALNGLSQNEVDFIVYDSTWTLGQVNSGKITPLAVTTSQRLAAFPDVPTFKEAGAGDVDITPWWGAVVPAGTPEPIKAKLSEWFSTIAAADDTRAFLAKFATEPYVNSASVMKDMLVSETRQWGELARIANIKPQ